MSTTSTKSNHDSLPKLRELGDDLLRVSTPRKFFTLTLPFIAMALYILFAWLRWWPLAVASVMMLSFVTYGSTSHDLVHRTLGLNRRANDFLLSLIELLSLRSGTAYRLTHIFHHRHLLEADDIEGSTAYASFWKALASGIVMQPRLWLWAWARYAPYRPLLAAEAAGVSAIIVAAVAMVGISPIPLVYAALVIMGSWLVPLITVYLPHDASGGSALTKTRIFRGTFARVIAFDHLYHLEHHLFPSVPHHHWKKLADRLDPYLAGQVGPNPTSPQS